MVVNEIIEYLKLQEKNLEFYKKEVERLNNQIKNIKQISHVNTFDLKLNKDQYSKDEIISAYNKMLKYEGIEHREGNLITNTMFDFLDGTHHSLNIK